MHAHFLISAAVAPELAHLKDLLRHAKVSEIGGRKIVSGDLAGKPVQLLATGPGLINTAQALTAAIQNARPAVLIQTGCAGAFRESGLTLGDIGVATDEVWAELGLERETDGLSLDEVPFTMLNRGKDQFKHRYPLAQNLTRAACRILKKRFQDGPIQVKSGPFLTSATITATDRRAKALHQRFNPCMEQMEGAAAAHLSLHYALPLVEIRAASNWVGKRDRRSWNLPLAFERCTRAVQAFVQTFNPDDELE